MKTLAKILTICLMIIPATACADNKPIKISDLPSDALAFIETFFPGSEIVYATKDMDFLSKSYDVVLMSGCKIEFNGKGEWKSVDCNRKGIPEGIVPEQILAHVNQKHPANFIVEIDRDTRDYEIQLDNGIEIKFDARFNVIKYDN